MVDSFNFSTSITDIIYTGSLIPAKMFNQYALLLFVYNEMSSALLPVSPNCAMNSLAYVRIVLQPIRGLPGDILGLQ